ncbi:hypothetical protein [Photobacterium leiognathi]|uniref:hypothetical protein n=1 Tax=Photobacterium leiognathi TaxID=553611 RepID=UPI0029818E6E|nr:hypothetical protein [Photobacterium leiognathi]
MSETEFQRQLEALGFKSTPENKTKRKNTSKVTSVHNNETAYRPQKQQAPTKTRTTAEAKQYAQMVINNMYGNHKNWESSTFRKAVKCVTGQNQILSHDEAKRVIRMYKDFPSKQYRLDYALAVLLLSGKWFPPKKKSIFDSKQTEARCSRRDLNGSIVGRHVYRN